MRLDVGWKFLDDNNLGKVRLGTGRYSQHQHQHQGGYAGRDYLLTYLLTDFTCERSVLFPGVTDCVFTLPPQAPTNTGERRIDRNL